MAEDYSDNDQSSDFEDYDDAEITSGSEDSLEVPSDDSNTVQLSFKL